MGCIENIKNSDFCVGLRVWGKLYLNGPKDGILENRACFECVAIELSGTILTVATIACLVFGILVVLGVIPESYILSNFMVSPYIIGPIFIAIGIIGTACFGSFSLLGYCQGILGINESMGFPDTKRRRKMQEVSLGIYS